MMNSRELKAVSEIRAKAFAKVCKRTQGMDIRKMKPVDVLAMGIFYGWKTSEGFEESDDEEIDE